MTAFWALWRREIKKFLFDRGRMGGALAQPILFWLVLGLGFQGSFKLHETSNVSFLEFLFPGMVMLVVLFTAIFSTVTIVEERKSGFLQAAIVAPISRIWLVLGNVAGGTSLGLLQALLFLIAAPFTGFHPTFWGVVGVLLICTATGVALGSLGFAMAWKVSSTRGFLALMNFFLMPLWLLSGAFFPLSGVPESVRWVIYLNPITYGMDALREALYGFQQVPIGTSFGYLPSLAIVTLFALAATGFAVYLVRKPIDLS